MQALQPIGPARCAFSASPGNRVAGRVNIVCGVCTLHGN
jgi:hypothetical protein